MLDRNRETDACVGLRLNALCVYISSACWVGLLSSCWFQWRQYQKNRGELRGGEKQQFCAPCSTVDPATHAKRDEPSGCTSKHACHQYATLFSRSEGIVVAIGAR